MTSMFDYDDSVNLAYDAKIAGKNLVAAKHELLNQTGDFFFLAHSDRELALRMQMVENDIEKIAFRRLANVSDSKAKLVRVVYDEWQLRHAKCEMCKLADGSAASFRQADEQDDTAPAAPTPAPSAPAAPAASSGSAASFRSQEGGEASLPNTNPSAQAAPGSATRRAPAPAPAAPAPSAPTSAPTPAPAPKPVNPTADATPGSAAAQRGKEGWGGPVAPPELTSRHDMGARSRRPDGGDGSASQFRTNEGWGVGPAPANNSPAGFRRAEGPTGTAPGTPVDSYTYRRQHAPVTAPGIPASEVVSRGGGPVGPAPAGPVGPSAGPAKPKNTNDNGQDNGRRR